MRFKVFWNVMLSGWLRVPLNFEEKLLLHHQERFVEPPQPLKMKAFIARYRVGISPASQAIMTEVLREFPHSFQGRGMMISP
jgi:hypothetical protein